MTNWCINELGVFGAQPELEAFKNTALTSHSLFDFNAFVPCTTDEIGWRVKNWGTKWPARDCELFESSCELEYRFATAHGPPIPVLLAASAQFPSVTFDLLCELETDEIYGTFEIKAGKIESETWETAEEFNLCDKDTDDEKMPP